MTKKRVAYVLAVVVLLLAAAGVFFWTNLDWIVKRAIVLWISGNRDCRRGQGQVLKNQFPQLKSPFRKSHNAP